MDSEIRTDTNNHIGDETTADENVTGTKDSTGENQQMNSRSCSSVHMAAAEGNIELLKTIFAQEESKKCCLVQDEKGLMPIHTAAQLGKVDALKIIFEACPEAAKKQIEKGDTAAHLAVRSNNFEVVKFLIDSTEDDPEFLNATNGEGNTILHLAVTRKQLQTIKFLIRRPGIDVNVRNRRGMTPLDRLYEINLQESQELNLELMLRSAGAVAVSAHLQPQTPRPAAATVSNYQLEYLNIVTTVSNFLQSPPSSASGIFFVFYLTIMFTLWMILHTIFIEEPRGILNLILRCSVVISLFFGGFACCDGLLQVVSQDYHFIFYVFLAIVLVLQAVSFARQASAQWHLSKAIKTTMFIGGVLTITAAVTYACVYFPDIWSSLINHSLNNKQNNSATFTACSDSTNVQNSDISFYISQCLERKKKTSVSVLISELKSIRHCLATAAAKHLLYSDEEILAGLQLPDYSCDDDEADDLWLLAIAYYLMARSSALSQDLTPT